MLLCISRGVSECNGKVKNRDDDDDRVNGTGFSMRIHNIRVHVYKRKEDEMKKHKKDKTKNKNKKNIKKGAKATAQDFNGRACVWRVPYILFYYSFFSIRWYLPLWCPGWLKRVM